MDKIVVLYISRNKDNKHIEDFKERRVSRFVENNPKHIREKFEEFVRKGCKGEWCRCYISLAPRDENIVKRKLIHELVDDNVDLTKIESKIASIAMQPECATEKKWLFDFDIDDRQQLEEFIKDIHKISPLMEIEFLKTPHGYSVITTSFDTRSLFEKWTPRGVTKDDLKKDNMKLIMWRTKE